MKSTETKPHRRRLLLVSCAATIIGLLGCDASPKALLPRDAAAVDTAAVDTAVVDTAVVDTVAVDTAVLDTAKQTPPTLRLLSPAPGYVADSPSVHFAWEDPSKPTAVYDLHIYSDAARTKKVVSTDGTVFDTNSIGTATSHTFDNDPSDGSPRYGLLWQWPDNTFNPQHRMEILFEYTAFTSAPVDVDDANRYEGPAHELSFLANMPVDNTGINFRTMKQGSIRFQATMDSLATVQLYLNWQDPPLDYNKGDGGLGEFTLHADSGGAPTGGALATTGPVIVGPKAFGWNQSAGQAKYPSAAWPVGGQGQQPKFQFTTTPTLTLGAWYHIVFSNVSPNPLDTFVSLNTSCFGYSPYDANMKRGDAPNWAAGSGAAWQKNSSDHWSEYSGCYAMYELTSGTGQVQGFPWFERGTPDDPDGEGDRAFNVTNTRRLRTVWTPTANTKIQRVGVCAVRRSGSGAMTLDIRQNGTLLHTTTLSGFPVRSGGATGEALYGAARFVEVAIPTTFTCVGGSDVYFEISTDKSTVYDVGTFLDGAKAGVFTGGPNSGSMNTFGQQTVDSGQTWTGIKNYGTARSYIDFGFYVQLAPP